MLTQVDIVNTQNQVLSLPFSNISSGYFVKKIDGLDPVKADIIGSPFASLDGELYQRARREPRNILISLGVAPTYSLNSVQSLRNSLYTFFMPKQRVFMKFYYDNVYSASIFGYIEVNDSPLFLKDPSVDISAICIDPDFLKSGGVTTVSGNTVTGSSEQIVAYPGTVATGFLFTLNSNASLTGFTIYNRQPNNDVKLLTFEDGILSGDKIEISTEFRDKYALRTRSATINSVLYGVKPISKWFPLEPGNNNIRVQASATGVPFTIKYTTRYGGL